MPPPSAPRTDGISARHKNLPSFRGTRWNRIGKDGASKIGDRDAWVGRVSKGRDAVLASGIHGRGCMPVHGGLADLSDEEMRSVVVYMFQQSTTAKK